MVLKIVHILSVEMNKLLNNQFDSYVKKFDMNIPQIRLKYYHSYEVQKLMIRLSNMLNLNEEEVYFASIIGLLHDIGRFPQIRDYGDCNDTKTGVDHAQLGVKYLFLEGHIVDFYDNEKKYDIIRDSISNHNKYKIDENISSESLYFSKMIRDMDKVDIFRVLSEEYEYFYDKEDITEEVLKQFNNNSSVLSKTRKTKTDSTISCLGFIYDLNFKESFIIPKETNYLNLFLDSVKVANDSLNEFNMIRKKINQYIESKIEEL